VFHYLRMPERHAAGRFDTALYPLGRDASPYQGVFSLMSRFPGVVWFLDPIVHHLAVGGIALMDDWAGYRDVLDTAYGDTGAALAQTVASNWGTGAVFRRYDLVAAVAAAQPGVLAAWPALADRVSSRLSGRPVGVASLAVTPVGSRAQAPAGDAERGGYGPPAGGARRVAIMTVNESYATTAVRAAAAVLARADDRRVSICLSEPVYKAEGRAVARHLGVEERIDWELTTAPRHLARVAADSGVLLWLAEELQGGHRLLLLEAMSAAKPTLVPRTPLYDDLPEGAVIKLDLGRTLAPMVAGHLDALEGEVELRESLGRCARAFVRSCPDIRASASALAAELEALRPAVSLQQAPVAAPMWRSVGESLREAALPGGAGADIRRQIEEVVRVCAKREGS
jgi:hypothetical protein